MVIFLSSLRVLMEIKTQIEDGESSAGSASVYREKLRTSSAVQVAPRKPFLLFASFMEATMIDKDLQGKNIYFEMSVGAFIRHVQLYTRPNSDSDYKFACTYNVLVEVQPITQCMYIHVYFKRRYLFVATGQFGNVLDAKAAKSFMANDVDSTDSGEDDDDEGDDSRLLKKKKDEEANLPCHSTTTPQVSDDVCRLLKISSAVNIVCYKLSQVSSATESFACFATVAVFDV